MTSKNKIIELLEKKNFNDNLDYSVEISLFEYGLVRNEKNNATIFFNPIKNKFDVLYIKFDDIIDILENIESDFFDYIGSSRKKELEQINNNYLGYMIFSINSWNGYLSSGLWYDMDYVDLIEFLEKL